MKLRTGKCLTCQCKAVLVAQNARKAHKIICSLFWEDNMNISLLEKEIHNVDVCPVCNYQLELLRQAAENFKENICGNACGLCGKINELLSLDLTNCFRTLIVDYQLSIKDKLCSTCLFYLSIRHTVKEKLLKNYPTLRVQETSKLTTNLDLKKVKRLKPLILNKRINLSKKIAQDSKLLHQIPFVIIDLVDSNARKSRPPIKFKLKQLKQSHQKKVISNNGEQRGRQDTKSNSNKNMRNKRKAEDISSNKETQDGHEQNNDISVDGEISKKKKKRVSFKEGSDEIINNQYNDFEPINNSRINQPNSCLSKPEPVQEQTPEVSEKHKIINRLVVNLVKVNIPNITNPITTDGSATDSDDDLETMKLQLQTTEDNANNDGNEMAEIENVLVEQRENDSSTEDHTHHSKSPSPESLDNDSVSISLQLEEKDDNEVTNNVDHIVVESMEEDDRNIEDESKSSGEPALESSDVNVVSTTNLTLLHEIRQEDNNDNEDTKIDENYSELVDQTASEKTTILAGCEDDLENKILQLHETNEKDVDSEVSNICNTVELTAANNGEIEDRITSSEKTVSENCDDLDNINSQTNNIIVDDDYAGTKDKTPLTQFEENDSKQTEADDDDDDDEEDETVTIQINKDALKNNADIPDDIVENDSADINNQQVNSFDQDKLEAVANLNEEEEVEDMNLLEKTNDQSDKNADEAEEQISIQHQAVKNGDDNDQENNSTPFSIESMVVESDTETVVIEDEVIATDSNNDQLEAATKQLIEGNANKYNNKKLSSRRVSMYAEPLVNYSDDEKEDNVSEPVEGDAIE